MKIALLLSGQARNWKPSFELTKKSLLDVYDVDVFCQLTWSDEIMKNGYVGRRGNFPIDSNTPELISQSYRPKKMFLREDYIFNQNDEIISKDFPNLPMSHQKLLNILQFKGMYEAYNLIENKNYYDFFVRIRYDCGFEFFPNLASLSRNNFYAGRDKEGTFDDRPDRFVDPSFIVGNNMKDYFKIYEYLINDFQSVNFEIAEEIHYFYTKKLNISDKLIKLPMDTYKLGCFTGIHY